MQAKAGFVTQQAMKFTVTQELTQAISLLQYSAEELTGFLEAKALENPFVRLKEPDLKAFYSERRPRTASEPDRLDQLAGSPGCTLGHFVEEQLRFSSFSSRQSRILSFLLQSLTESGYIEISSREAAQLLGEPEADVRHVKNKIKQMEPAGVGASGLQECLLLQAERHLEAPYLAEQILRHHFCEFASKKWKPVAKQLGTGVKEIQQAADFIRTLCPKPGAAFSGNRAAFIYPDITVKQEGSQINVDMHEQHVPDVQFDEEYFSKLASYADKEVKAFVKEKEKDYQWLVKSLGQRRQTICRVGLQIVARQQRFFQEGPGFLQPLTMKEIAEELLIHESTVSRTVRGKYMQTPYGICELKSFFATGLSVSSRTGEAASSDQVKKQLQQLVAEENKQKPLSDQSICSALLQRGLPVSRRTVAKYRDQLNIASSAKRKRYE